MPRSSSSRRSNKWSRPHRDLSSSMTSRRSVDRDADGEWIVQETRGSASGKTYTCPGCRLTLPASAPHVVAWRTEAGFGLGVGVEARRHWHSACFRARARG